MDANATRVAEKVRARRLLLSSAAMFLLAGGVLGGLSYQQRQAQSERVRHIQQVAAEQAALEPSKAQVAERVARFRQLRDKWRPWALQHKEELKRMLRGDPVALTAIYNAAPATPSSDNTGLTMADVQFTDREFRAGKRLIFSWTPLAKVYGSEALKREKAARAKKIFRTLGDMVLSGSINKGRSCTQFWVSGRITEHKWIDNPKIAPGKPVLVRAPPVEIEPAYDFLKQ